ncbi:hypothetical protein QUC31_007083 [Theobroma cacao]
MIIRKSRRVRTLATEMKVANKISHPPQLLHSCSCSKLKCWVNFRRHGGFMLFSLGRVPNHLLLLNMGISCLLVCKTYFEVVLGKKRRDTVCIVLADEQCEGQKFRMIKHGNPVHILPIDDTSDGLTIDLGVFLRSYFLEDYPPVRKGDIFIAKGAMRTAEFKVIDTDPGEYCVVVSDTIVNREGEPITAVTNMLQRKYCSLVNIMLLHQILL